VEGLEVVLSQAIYRGDAVLRRAAALQAHPLTTGARIVLHPQDAKSAGLAADGLAKVANGTGTATLPVLLSDRVAPGCAWIESGYGATAALAAARVEVRGA
jgi:NADH-quinone oxidoreductase subunit G